MNNFMIEECHGLHFIDTSDDTLDDNEFSADEATVDSDDEACEHNDGLECGHCIDCGEYVPRYNEDDGCDER